MDLFAGQTVFDSPPAADCPLTYRGLAAFHKYWGKKPVELYTRMLEAFTLPGDVVLEPFLGSAVAVLALQGSRRRLIGVDINPISALLAQLFCAPPTATSFIKAFELMRTRSRGPILDSYRRLDGQITSHVLWKAEIPVEVRIQEGNNRRYRAISPEAGDRELIERFRAYVPRSICTPRFTDNPRINSRADLTLRSIFTGRALRNIDLLVEAVDEFEGSPRLALTLALTAALGQMSKMVFAIQRRGKMRGEKIHDRIEVGSWVIGYWRPELHFEVNTWSCFENKCNALLRGLPKFADVHQRLQLGKGTADVLEQRSDCVFLTDSCLRTLPTLPNESIDLIVADPPHDDRIPYLELSELWNAILGIRSDFEGEIVVSNAKNRKKGRVRFYDDIRSFLEHSARVLKPGKKLVLIFNHSRDGLLGQIRSSGEEAGLVLRGRFAVDYSATSVVQDNRTGAVKSDWALVFEKGEKDAQPSMLPDFVIPFQFGGLPN